MTPPNQVLQLIERFERYLDKYKRPDHKEARGRLRDGSCASIIGTWQASTYSRPRIKSRHSFPS